MFNHSGSKTIETDRLIIREANMNDAQSMFDNWASDDEVTRYLTWDTYEDISQANKRIEDLIYHYMTHKYYYEWFIELKEINQPIGSISANSFNEEDNSCEIGYCIGKNFWGNGYVPEAVDALLKYLFEEVGVNIVYAEHDIDNPNSGKVMEKCGMKYISTFEQKISERRGVVKVCKYSINKDEWREFNLMKKLGNIEKIEYPRLSIIITCYKPEDIVEDSIRSFARQHLSDYLDIVLVDDCSPYTEDSYQSLIDKYKDRINIQHLKTPENCGPGDARQYGFDNAEPKNEFVLFHDADELCYEPDGMTYFLEAIRENDNPSITRYAGGYREFFEEEEGEFREKLTEPRDNNRITSNVFRRSFLEEKDVKFDHEMSYHDEDAMFFFIYYLEENNSNMTSFYLEDGSITHKIVWEKNHKGAGSPENMYLSHLGAQFMILCLKRMVELRRHKRLEDSNNGSFCDGLESVPYLVPYVVENALKEIKHVKNFDLELLREKYAICKRLIREAMDIVENIDDYSGDCGLKKQVEEEYSSNSPEGFMTGIILSMFEPEQDVVPFDKCLEFLEENESRLFKESSQE